MENIVSSTGVLQAAELLRHAHHPVALSGAGISTPSGIPDFRSRGTGLWERYDPMQVASLTAFRKNPQAFYEWILPLARKMATARPNPAHLALAGLEAAGRLDGVVTQNIDGLHREAGSRTVVELHGNIRQAICVRCYRIFTTQRILERLEDDLTIPHCPECGGVLKPDVVLYGEQLPYKAVHQAEALIEHGDLVLVIGSSLEVMPAAGMPVPALNRGARLIIANRDPTYLDQRADVILRQDLAQILPELAHKVMDHD
jgi:NAD-dependent deacetylase